MPKPSKLIAVIPLLAALPLLTGCITIAVPSTTPDPIITTDTPPPDDPNTEEPPPSDPTDVTAPGTVLSMSESALVPFSTGGSSKYNIQLSIIGIRTGSISDFDGFSDSDKKKLADKTPFYVDIKVQAASGPGVEELEGYPIPPVSVGALDQDGSWLTTLSSYYGDFEPCIAGAFDKAGAMQACFMFAGSSAQTLTAVTWQHEGDGYSDIDGQPIIWK
jgi:hypothetical protein